ncbi:MAG TPA: xanthine dehydrogenase family protein subunit M [Thermoanaerobaculia bacterium]|jgi:CO/xanthine dehydrogenase FAD-binding subunit|nr:xanthine dehydrogenase family protein subunit M [Thermoanaerobaculia bacterium]
MRSNLPAYELATPPDLGGALALLVGGYRPFAGGTDLMVLAEAGKLPHRRWVSVWGLGELRGVTVSPKEVTIGALTTYSQVQHHELLRTEYPLLAAAAAETGGVAIQNRGTLGGNVANGSPAADSPPALLVYDAELELVSPDGIRRVPYSSFHRGYRKMDLGTGELIRAFRLPRRPPGRWRETYRKVGTRRAQAISKVCFAGAIAMAGEVVDDIRLALGSVAPMPLRCARTEAVLRGQPLTPAAIADARAELAREIAPIDDFRSTARYRLRVAQELLVDFLRQPST